MQVLLEQFKLELLAVQTLANERLRNISPLINERSLELLPIIAQKYFLSRTFFRSRCVRLRITLREHFLGIPAIVPVVCYSDSCSSYVHVMYGTGPYRPKSSPDPYYHNPYHHNSKLLTLVPEIELPDTSGENDRNLWSIYGFLAALVHHHKQAIQDLNARNEFPRNPRPPHKRCIRAPVRYGDWEAAPTKPIQVITGLARVRTHGLWDRHLIGRLQTADIHWYVFTQTSVEPRFHY